MCKITYNTIGGSRVRLEKQKGGFVRPAIIFARGQTWSTGSSITPTSSGVIRFASERTTTQQHGQGLSGQLKLSVARTDRIIQIPNHQFLPQNILGNFP
jgi:hypothetical protein